MEDKKLKKKLAKIPDVDKNGDPIYKIADINESGSQPSKKSTKDEKLVSR